MSDDASLDGDQATRLLRAFDLAMKTEGIDDCRREHILNRLIYGDPHPCRRHVNEIEIHITTPTPQASPAELARRRAAHSIRIQRY